MNYEIPIAEDRSIGHLIVGLAQIWQPPERLTVSEAAEEYVYINQPGAYVGKYSGEMTPYMREPSDLFNSHEFEGIIFVSSAQSGKTQALILNPIAYSVKCDPMDMMVVCPTNTAARDFSIRRIDRLNRYSDVMRDLLMPGSNNDNVFDKHYKNGMLLSLSWPSPSELAGKPIGRVVLTDRDRMEDDVGGDGEPYDLAAKRTTTFGSYAMTIAESSPSRPVENPKWIAKTPHEAPPAAGILSLYNRGDRRRWQWPCPHCDRYFEGTFEMLEWDSDHPGTNLDKGMTARMRCPLCGELIHPDSRDMMNAWGLWVKDGQSVDRLGLVIGPASRSRIASFWLRGVAATFITWSKLVNLYLDANDTYERTGSEEALKKFYNNDLGEPYISKKSLDDRRLPETLKAREDSSLGERSVPSGVRFLVATVDVQKNMFVVQVFGVLPGMPFDAVLIDRYDIRKSKRTDGDGEHLWVKPNVYDEDWDEILEHVIEREYVLGDGSGRMMGIRFVGCDSGGREGVTTRAYNFYRRLREKNKHRRFVLTKGDPSPNNPRTRITYPDSSRKDRNSGARGDVPVLLINSNIVKDELSGRLDCLIPGKGMIRFPSWLSDKFYEELCAEIRTAKGWENPSNSRNEAWDLGYYFIAICVSEFIRVEHLDWANPPGWAAEFDKNELVRAAQESARFRSSVESELDFSSFGKALG